jgi:hypothetical protein
MGHTICDDNIKNFWVLQALDAVDALKAQNKELLEALEGIIGEFAEDKAEQGMCADPYTLGRINRAEAAIAKAKGGQV